MALTKLNGTRAISQWAQYLITVKVRQCLQFIFLSFFYVDEFLFQCAASY